MSIRVEVQPDLQIEIQRPGPSGGPSKFVCCKDLEAALRIMRFLLKRDLERAQRERFVPQVEREAKKAYKTLEAQSPYGTEKKTR